MVDSILGPHLSIFDSCREWGRGWGCRDGPQTAMPKVPAHTLPTVYMNILTFSLKKKKKKNVHFISPYLLLRLFSVTSLWFTLKYVDDT